MFSKLKIENRGFTLSELIVVIAIATILMTALVIANSRWDDSLVVNTQAYEMALMFRQAQHYALGVREAPSGGGDKFNSGYGIFFGNLDVDPPETWKTKYIFFADTNNNGVYDEGVDSVVESKTLNRGVVIDSFCGRKGVGQFDEKCHPSEPGIGNVSFAHITFSRPNPEANIIFWNNGGGLSQNVVPPAKIYLISPKGKYYRVSIEVSGRVFVDQSEPEE